MLQRSSIPSRTLVVLALCLAALAWIPAAQAQPAGPPRVSPMATVSQVVGLAKVEITYSRPYVKGREVFGGLEPFGKVWRTGANEATTIRFSDDVKVEGKPLPAGTYGLFTIPRETGAWTVIFNKEAEQWGAFQYKEAEDALRVDVTPKPTGHTEMLTISIGDVTPASAVVRLAWKETLVPFTVAFDTDAIALTKAKTDFEKAKGGDSDLTQSVWQWASYFQREGEHQREALEMITGVPARRESYSTVALKARLLAATGSPKEAVTAAHQALEMGKKALEERPNPNLAQDMEKLEGEAGKWSMD